MWKDFPPTHVSREMIPCVKVGYIVLVCVIGTLLHARKQGIFITLRRWSTGRDWGHHCSTVRCNAVRDHAPVKNRAGSRLSAETAVGEHDSPTCWYSSLSPSCWLLMNLSLTRIFSTLSVTFVFHTSHKTRKYSAWKQKNDLCLAPSPLFVTDLTHPMLLVFQNSVPRTSKTFLPTLNPALFWHSMRVHHVVCPLSTCRRAGS